MESSDLRKAGLKVTLPRLKILEILETGTERHFSAEDVYRQLMELGEEKISLATVYRVLDQFQKAGLVSRHNFDAGPDVFELDEGTHHDHILCTECGKVVEFVDSTIERRQHQIAQANGFELTDHSLVLYGRCAATDCKQRKR